MTERTTNRFTTQWRSALPDDPNDSSRHKVHAIAHNVITTLVNTAGVIDLITYLTHWGQHLLASDSAEVEKYNLNVRRRVLTGLPEPSFGDFDQGNPALLQLKKAIRDILEDAVRRSELFSAMGIEGSNWKEVAGIRLSPLDPVESFVTILEQVTAFEVLSHSAQADP